MPIDIVALVLLSALLHPLWNTLLKKGGRYESDFLVLTLLVALFAGVHAVVGGHDLASIMKIWPIWLASFAGQLLYGFFLVMTLRQGDLSAYYPIIRSSPALIVVLGFLFMGQRYSPLLLAGIVLVLVGGYQLQRRPGMRPFSEPRILVCALLSMTGVATYSLADSEGVRHVAPSVLFFWVELSCLVGYVLLFRVTGDRAVRWNALFLWLRRPLRGLAVGVLAYVSYWLILEAYAQGGNVAAVTAVRQASIPISVLLGGMVLREGAMFRRLGASLLLAAGIMVIVLS